MSGKYHTSQYCHKKNCLKYNFALIYPCHWKKIKYTFFCDHICYLIEEEMKIATLSCGTTSGPTGMPIPVPMVAHFHKCLELFI